MGGVDEGVGAPCERVEPGGRAPGAREVVPVEEGELGGVHDRAARGERRELELLGVLVGKRICRRGRASLIMSVSDMTVVLEGAWLSVVVVVEGGGEPGIECSGSWRTPQPESASQFRTASGSQPRFYQEYISQTGLCSDFLTKGGKEVGSSL